MTRLTVVLAIALFVGLVDTARSIATTKVRQPHHEDTWPWASSFRSNLLRFREVHENKASLNSKAHTSAKETDAPADSNTKITIVNNENTLHPDVAALALSAGSGTAAPPTGYAAEAMRALSQVLGERGLGDYMTLAQQSNECGAMADWCCASEAYKRALEMLLDGIARYFQTERSAAIQKMGGESAASQFATIVTQGANAEMQQDCRGAAALYKQALHLLTEVLIRFMKTGTIPTGPGISGLTNFTGLIVGSGPVGFAPQMPTSSARVAGMMGGVGGCTWNDPNKMKGSCDSVMAGGSCVVMCDKGFSVDTPVASLSCVAQSDGTAAFSAKTLPQCVASCTWQDEHKEKGSCDNLGPGASCTPACARGWELTPPTGSIMCGNAGGQFTAVPPKCAGSKCSWNVANKKVGACENVPAGKSCNVVCAAGYKLEPPTATMLVCSTSGATFEGTVPKCSGSMCNWSGTNKAAGSCENVQPGTSCVASCMTGFDLNDPLKAKLICGNAGGEFTESVPRCLGKTCSWDDVNKLTGSCERIPAGGKCTATCQRGFKMVPNPGKDSVELTCGAQGGTFAESPPKCTKYTCQEFWSKSGCPSEMPVQNKDILKENPDYSCTGDECPRSCCRKYICVDYWTDVDCPAKSSKRLDIRARDACKKEMCRDQCCEALPQNCDLFWKNLDCPAGLKRVVDAGSAQCEGDSCTRKCCKQLSCQDYWNDVKNACPAEDGKQPALLNSLSVCLGGQDCIESCCQHTPRCRQVTCDANLDMINDISMQDHACDPAKNAAECAKICCQKRPFPTCRDFWRTSTCLAGTVQKKEAQTVQCNDKAKSDCQMACCKEDIVTCAEFLGQSTCPPKMTAKDGTLDSRCKSSECSAQCCQIPPPTCQAWLLIRPCEQLRVENKKNTMAQCTSDDECSGRCCMTEFSCRVWGAQNSCSKYNNRRWIDKPSTGPKLCGAQADGSNPGKCEDVCCEEPPSITCQSWFNDELRFCPAAMGLIADDSKSQSKCSGNLPTCVSTCCRTKPPPPTCRTYLDALPCPAKMVADPHRADATCKEGDDCRTFCCSKCEWVSSGVNAAGRMPGPGNPRIVGDPHIQSADGIWHDLMQAGEYVLWMDPYHNEQVNVRVYAQTPALGLACGIAFRSGSHAVSWNFRAASPVNNFEHIYMVDGQAKNDGTFTAGQLTASYVNRDLTIKSALSGFTVSTRVQFMGPWGYLDTTFAIAGYCKNTKQGGLLGRYDQNIGTEWQTKEGALSNFDAARVSWQVTSPDDSLFSSKTEWGRDPTPPNTDPLALAKNNPVLVSRAFEACAAKAGTERGNCVVDFISREVMKAPT